MERPGDHEEARVIVQAKDDNGTLDGNGGSGAE